MKFICLLILNLSQMPNILLAEDDASLGYLLKDNLEAEGFTINL